jgi:hypothetical protein
MEHEALCSFVSSHLRGVNQLNIDPNVQVCDATNAK